MSGELGGMSEAEMEAASIAQQESEMESAHFIACVESGTCPKCSKVTFRYRAEIAAPGHGQLWECCAEGCNQSLIVIGRTCYDPTQVSSEEAPPWELTPEDVR